MNLRHLPHCRLAHIIMFAIVEPDQTKACGEKRSCGDHSFLLVRSSPPVQDPRELQTILISSLASLFGHFQPHSSSAKVLSCRAVPGSDFEYDAVIQCDRSSADAVRAALTMCTPPPYLRATKYRFDCLKCEATLEDLV